MQLHNFFPLSFILAREKGNISVLEINYISGRRSPLRKNVILLASQGRRFSHYSETSVIAYHTGKTQ